MSGDAEDDDSEVVTNGVIKVKPVPARKEDSVSSVRSDSLDSSSVNTTGLLSTSMKEVARGGLTQFTKMNSKILEIVSQNNVLLLERVRDMEEGCHKQIREKDEQIKRLQNLLSNKDDQMKKLTGKIEAGAEFDEKAKKFFGDNEDYYKKKVEEVNKANKELAAKLGESEARRMENLLEEADTTKIREAVTGLTTITEDIQSKTEQVLNFSEKMILYLHWTSFQVWAVVQGMDGGSVSMGGDGEKTKDALAGSSTVGLLHNKVDKMIRLMVETSENQKKMNKTLGELLKSGFHKAETPSTCKTQYLRSSLSVSLFLHSATPAVPDEGGERERDREGERKRRRRDRERSRDREEPVAKDKRSRSPDSSIESSSLQAGPGAGGGIDHEFEEMKWGLNMALIGENCQRS